MKISHLHKTLDELGVTFSDELGRRILVLVSENDYVKMIMDKDTESIKPGIKIMPSSMVDDRSIIVARELGTDM